MDLISPISAGVCSHAEYKESDAALLVSTCLQTPPLIVPTTLVHTQVSLVNTGSENMTGTFELCSSIFTIDIYNSSGVPVAGFGGFTCLRAPTILKLPVGSSYVNTFSWDQAELSSTASGIYLIVATAPGSIVVDSNHTVSFQNVQTPPLAYQVVPDQIPEMIFQIAALMLLSTIIAMLTIVYFKIRRLLAQNRQRDQQESNRS